MVTLDGTDTVVVAIIAYFLGRFLTAKIDLLETEEAADEVLRLFMVPVVRRCRGGPGVTGFDALSALEDWVEGDAPETLLATSPELDLSRPICAYPAATTLTGDPADPTSYTCK